MSSFTTSSIFNSPAVDLYSNQLLELSRGLLKKHIKQKCSRGNGLSSSVLSMEVLRDILSITRNLALSLQQHSLSSPSLNQRISYFGSEILYSLNKTPIPTTVGGVLDDE